MVMSSVNTLNYNALVAFRMFAVMDKPPAHYAPAYKADDIYGAYVRPSVAKVNVWRYWVKVCRALNEHSNVKQGACFADGNIHIASANSQMFTVEFDFWNPVDGTPMHAYITPRYNRCWPR